MLLCYLRHNVEASCQTLYRRLPPSTNTAAYQRLARHGPLQLAFTARDSARYWLRIAICAYPSRLRKFCSLPQVFFGQKVLCLRDKWSQLHRIQKITENIHVSDGLRRIVTFLIIAPYEYSYLLTYLLTLPAFDTPIRGRGSRRNLTVPSVNYPISEVIFTQVILCSTLV